MGAFSCPESKKALEAQAKIEKRVMNGGVKNRRQRARCLIKRRACRDKAASGNEMMSRIGELKKLVPNSESTGIDGLFRETSAYILSLQMTVQIMQVMVKVLADSDD